MLRLSGINLGCFLEYENTWQHEVNIYAIVNTLKTHNMNTIRLIVSSDFISNKDLALYIRQSLSLRDRQPNIKVISFKESF